MLFILILFLAWGCAPAPTWPLNVGTDVLVVADNADASVLPDAAADTTFPPETGTDATQDTGPDVLPDVVSDVAPFDPRDLPRFPEVRPGMYFPRIYVQISPDWSPEQARAVRQGLAILAPVAPDILETNDVSLASVVITPVVSPDCDARAGDVFTRTAYVDPRCFPTAAGFTFSQAVAHLALHALGARHLCVAPGESSTDCAPVPYGRGLLNAHFAEERTPTRTRLGWTAGLSEFDIAEVRRVLTTDPWRLP